MRRKVIILTIGVLLVVGLILYFIQMNKYKDIFLEGTIINGEDCSFLTIEEAKELLQSEEEQYELEIQFKNNEKVTINGNQIQLKLLQLEEDLSNIKKEQIKKFIFLKFSKEPYIAGKLSYNVETLREEIATIDQLHNEYMEERSKIIYNESNKCFQREDIYYLDSEEVYNQIVQAIEKRKTSISMEEEGLYKISGEDSVLNELNALVETKIVYDLPREEQYVLDIDTLRTWLVQENGYYKKDDEMFAQKIEEFVTDDLYPRADTTGETREFKPTEKDTTVFVEGGNYGYMVDKEGEVEQLTKDLSNHVNIEREPVYKKVEASIANNNLGNSYVEIDITRQKVWVYKDGNLEVETDCVTGNVRKGHDTPTGVFTLTYKEKDRILRGKKLPNGQYEYQSHVNYWMPFNGGIGLHDASWRRSFGKNIYLTNGSHGCVNLPKSAAEKIYNIIDYTMPIIVYKSN